MAVYVEYNATLACLNACENAFMLTYFFVRQVSFGVGVPFRGLGSFRPDWLVAFDAKDMRFYFFSGAVVFPEKPMRTFLGLPSVAALSVVTSST